LLVACALGDDDRSGKDAEGLMERAGLGRSCAGSRRLVLPLLAGLLALGWVSRLQAQRVDGNQAQPSDVAAAETEARRLVEDYYEELLGYNCTPGVSITRDAPQSFNPNSLFRPLCDIPDACTGTSLSECMGGESLCSLNSYLAAHCRVQRAAAGRQVLLEALDRIGLRAPGSDWIVGQRVSLALKNGQQAHARAIADSCAAALWWCQALRGYARHAQAAGSGEAQLDSALAGAPRGTSAWAQPSPEWEDPGLRCSWTDLSLLLTGQLLLDYTRLACDEREELESHFWWLADPMWSTPGNERRSEHLVRHLQVRLDGYVRSRSPNFHARVIPVGWPNSWGSSIRPVRADEDPARMTEDLRVQHELFVNGGYSFAPDESRFADPTSSTAEDWAVEWNEGTERMQARETWHNLEHHQLAILRRDEGLFAVGAARSPVAVSSAGGARGALAMGRAADLRIEVAASDIDPGDVMRASASLDHGDWVASFEMAGEDWIGRARYGAPAPKLMDGFGLSTPALVDERFEERGMSLVEALLPSTSLSSPRVGVYFEIYGVTDGEPLQVSVLAVSAETSMVRRFTNLLRLTSDVALNVGWSEPATKFDGRMERFVALDLRALQDGEYNLAVTVQRVDGASATSARSLRVTTR
jgi:hypothetical protein